MRRFYSCDLTRNALVVGLRIGSGTEERAMVSVVNLDRLPPGPAALANVKRVHMRKLVRQLREATR